MIETGEPAKGGDRGSHLPALDRAEESDRNIGRARHLRERSFPFQSQTPQTRTHRARLRSLASVRQQFVSFEQVNDGGSIHAAGAPKELSAFQNANVGMRIDSVLAMGASRDDQSKILPSTKDRRRNADDARDVTDAQIAVRVRIFRGAFLRPPQFQFPLDNLWAIF